MLLDEHKGPPVDDEDCILDPKALQDLPSDHPNKKYIEKLDGIIIDDVRMSYTLIPSLCVPAQVEKQLDLHQVLRQRLVDKLPPGASMVVSDLHHISAG